MVQKMRNPAWAALYCSTGARPPSGWGDKERPAVCRLSGFVHLMNGLRVYGMQTVQTSHRLKDLPPRAV
jgi:hypothetical protein